MIYFFLEPFIPAVKIGYSTDPERRLRELQLKVAPELGEQDRLLRLLPLGVMQGDFKGERALHERFAQWRISGEWFQPAFELMEYVKENTIPMRMRWDSPLWRHTRFLYPHEADTLIALAAFLERYGSEAFRRENVAEIAQYLPAALPANGRSWRHIRYAFHSWIRDRYEPRARHVIAEFDAAIRQLYGFEPWHRETAYDLKPAEAN